MMFVGSFSGWNPCVYSLKKVDHDHLSNRVSERGIDAEITDDLLFEKDKFIEMYDFMLANNVDEVNLWDDYEEPEKRLEAVKPNEKEYEYQSA